MVETIQEYKPIVKGDQEPPTSWIDSRQRVTKQHVQEFIDDMNGCCMSEDDEQLFLCLFSKKDLEDVDEP